MCVFVCGHLSTILSSKAHVWSGSSMYVLCSKHRNFSILMLALLSVVGLSLRKVPTQTYTRTNIHTHTRMCNLDMCMLDARSVCGLLLHHDFGIKARSSGPVSLGSGAAHRPFEVAVIGVRFSSSHNNSAKLPAASRSSASLPWLAWRNFVAV